MTPTLQALARRIAACPAFRWRAGMACRDPETGNSYRKRTYGGDQKVAWMLDDYGPDVDRYEFDHGLWDERWRHATTAGPLLTDPCTLGGLLEDLPTCELDNPTMDRSGEWEVWIPRDGSWYRIGAGPDRATAIALAYLAQHEAP